MDKALQRIAAMAIKHSLPPARGFMADETFLFHQRSNTILMSHASVWDCEWFCM